MTPAYLIQVGVGVACAALLHASAPRHARYCERFGITLHHCLASRAHPQWAKIEFINSTLAHAEEGALLVYIDADALIVGDEDVRNAMPLDANLGMYWRQGLNMWNCGVIFARNCPEARALFLAAMEQGPLPGAVFYDQETVNQIIEREHINVFALPVKWNSYVETDPKPNIITWHGIHKEVVLAQMKTLLKETR